MSRSHNVQRIVSRGAQAIMLSCGEARAMSAGSGGERVLRFLTVTPSSSSLQLSSNVPLASGRGFASSTETVAAPSSDAAAEVPPPSIPGSIIKERLQLTEEMKHMLFAKKERHNAPAIVVRTLQEQPKGMTANEIWEKVKGKHEGFVSRATLKDLLNKMSVSGHRGQKLLAVRAAPFWRYTLIPQVTDRKLQKLIVRRAKAAAKKEAAAQLLQGGN